MEILSQISQLNKTGAVIKKPNVGIIIRSFNRGGAEVLIREMFDNKRFNEATGICDLIILDSKRLELLKDLKNVNYYIINIFSSPLLSFFIEYRKLYKLLKLKQYDVLHVHLPNAAIILRLLKFLMPKLRLVYSEHNIVDSYKKITYLLSGLTYYKDNHTIFVSREVEACVNRHRKSSFYNYKNGSVIINGINVHKFYSTDKNNGHYTKNYLTVGTVVSFRKAKRLDRWVETAAAVRGKYPLLNIKFILAGIGPEKAAIDEMILQKKLTDYIEMPGLVINTPEIYNKLDIFLMTSEFEGLPVALLEAMSCACVPVISNVGGIRDLDFDDFGYKYESFDADILANVIADYYTNKSKVIAERNKARKFIVENNSLEKQVEGYLNIYKNVMDNS
ncbi:glycosyltransferase [Parafilimonas sp.]|uniref:glycosyltransferase n=1 Tax=Parafilimonas sp. TaxID=1969739 RepID=UPI003F7F29FE